MAELATIARPYAEALDQSVSGEQALSLIPQLQALAAVAANPDMQQLADNPKVTAAQVFGVITGVAKATLDPKVQNLLRTVVDNGRLAALPEIAAQFNALVKSRSGTSDATIESAFPIDAAQLQQVVAALEKRFGRKLNASVVVDPELIGGIRVVVGDEVLDTSVRARLEKMRLALAA
ncbi:MAG TPA: F0F1 ATP synthase subunit delta [Burkholderiaceae bacterium]|nr:F0F1 ATP synthase subunit delta [Burkholderiaceae bacterium]